jgi:hypothetical protein
LIVISYPDCACVENPVRLMKIAKTSFFINDIFIML